MLEKNDMPTIIFLGGKNNAGKTTHAIPALVGMGYTVCSGSVLLHRLTSKLLFTFFFEEEKESEIPSTLDKSTDLGWEFFFKVKTKLVGAKKLNQTRGLLIDIAEYCLKEVLGEDIIAYAVMNEAERLINQGGKVVIETIGGKEYEIFKKMVQSKFKDKYRFNTLSINIRRNGEGECTKKLLEDGVDVWNNTNYEDMCYKLLKTVLGFR